MICDLMKGECLRCVDSLYCQDDVGWKDYLGRPYDRSSRVYDSDDQLSSGKGKPKTVVATITV